MGAFTVPIDVMGVTQVSLNVVFGSKQAAAMSRFLFWAEAV